MWSTPRFKCGASIWRHSRASNAAGQGHQALTRKQALAAVADVATEDLERMVALKRIAYLCSGLDNACLLRIVRDTDSQTRAHPRPEGDDSQVPAAF